MESYKPVSWSSEPLSIDKMQLMIQNDQSIADEIDLRPRGVIGYSELTMYASNTGKKGYRDVNRAFYPAGSTLANMTDVKNTGAKIREYTRVIDNWEINPNGLSLNINVEPNRIIHFELYIPIFTHNNPNVGPNTSDNWAIDAFVITRDGEQIIAESGTDLWTAMPGSRSLRSFYYDCFDVRPTSGPHLYEVMWRCQSSVVDQQLEMEIWEQNRNTIVGLPSSVTEPDQQYYSASDATAIGSASGRYNLSDFTSAQDSPMKYTELLSGVENYTGNPNVSPATFSGSNTFPFAGVIPTAQFIATDCGSAYSAIIKVDGEFKTGDQSENTTA
jgi:hypothetical protein